MRTLVCAGFVEGVKLLGKGRGMGEKKAADRFYAHSLEGAPPEKWQPLEDHLRNVAEMAEGFSSRFGCGAWGRQAGLWHALRIWVILTGKRSVYCEKII